MKSNTKLLLPLVITSCITGCAGSLKYTHSLDNLPDDPTYFAPDATITPNSKLVARKVTVRMAPAHKTIKGADDPTVYEEFRTAYEREYLPKYLVDNCPFTKEGSGTEGIYFVDAEIEAVLFDSSKETKQALGSLFFGNFASGLQDKKTVKTNFSVYDSAGKLVAAHRSDFEPVQSAPLLSKEWMAAGATVPNVVKLCGSMQASYAELEKRNSQSNRQ